jgi:hypothetical protein
MVFHVLNRGVASMQLFEKPVSLRDTVRFAPATRPRKVGSGKVVAG